jgi:hypothetical protein
VQFLVLVYCWCVTLLLFSLIPILKNEKRLMRSPCCLFIHLCLSLCLCVTINFFRRMRSLCFLCVSPVIIFYFLCGPCRSKEKYAISFPRTSCYINDTRYIRPCKVTVRYIFLHHCCAVMHLPQRHSVHHKIPHDRPGLEPRTAAVGSQRLTA